MVNKRMEWSKLLTEERVGIPKNFKNGNWNPHVRDYDRVVFSKAFHRLGRKTQVHPLSENDHVHNRLTHSVEVSTVGRSIAYLISNDIKKNHGKDIPRDKNGKKDRNFVLKFTSVAQAACLAHDIGNSPFGHAGEHAIREWFTNKFRMNASFLNVHIPEKKWNDFKLYEGNAQGFRICSHYDISHKEYGLKLTYASLGALIKYPWLSTSKNAELKKKFNVYYDELEIFYAMANSLGLINKNENKGISELEYARHPISYIVEAADDICYKIIDIEDAIELGAISYNNLRHILKESGLEETFIQDISDYDKLIDKTKLSRIRSKAIGFLINASRKCFMENYNSIMYGEFNTTLLDDAKRKNEDIDDLLTKLKDLTDEKIFKIPRKIEIEVGSYSTIEILLDAFIPAVEEFIKKGEKGASFKTKRILDLMEEDFNKEEIQVNIKNRRIDDLDEIYYKSFMRTMDFISGMTDNYATYIAKQISGDAN